MSKKNRIALHEIYAMPNSHKLEWWCVATETPNLLKYLNLSTPDRSTRVLESFVENFDH